MLPNSRRRWLPPAVTLFLIGWGANQFASMLTFYQGNFGFSRLTVTLMLSVYIFGLVPALLISGGWSDKYGRKRITFIALLVAVFGSVAMVIGAWWSPWIFPGRLLSGVATGIAMAATTSWIKELSQPPWDAAADVTSGARRASLFVTGGFFTGPVVSGLLAAYAPAPAVIPYGTHIALCIPLIFLLLQSPETRATQRGVPRTHDRDRQLWAYVRAPSRFRTVILPAAPWAFGSGTIGFAVVPQLLISPSSPILHSTLSVGLTMGCGVAVQSLGRKIDTPTSARSIIIALIVSFVGLIFALMAALLQITMIGFIASGVLGCGYGLLLVSGALETQRLSAPQHLGEAMGKFYALAYTGFLAPSIISLFALEYSDTTIIIILLLISASTITYISLNSRNNL
ncbi:MFS transporter [Nesterenkonia sp. E16_7]|nr:MFS transporter [Nesterenkonia sp. E16_10]MBO0597168.1 MFS transporter [Nesterenkonia sp. E16_7]